MSDNVDAGTMPEDNEVVRTLRSKLKEAEANAKSAAEEARAQVKRELRAEALMPEQFKGLTEYFLQETDGDVTEDAIATWLAAKVATAAPESDAENQVDEGSLSQVADLAGSVAAVSSVAPAEDSVMKQIQEAGDGMYGDNLPELTAKLSSILN